MIEYWMLIVSAFLGGCIGVAFMRFETCVPGMSFFKWLYYRIDSPYLKNCYDCSDYWNLPDFCLGSAIVCPYDEQIKERS